MKAYSKKTVSYESVVIEKESTEESSENKEKSSLALKRSFSKDKMKILFLALRKKLGPIEKCLEFTTYQLKNMELTVFPDGSSFCHRVTRKQLKTNLPSSLMTIMVEKTKIPNDTFPCQFQYDCITETIDLIFPWKGLKLILRVKGMDDNEWLAEQSTVSTIKQYCKNQQEMNWCEILICYEKAEQEDILECQKFIQKCFISASACHKKDK